MQRLILAAALAMSLVGCATRVPPPPPPEYVAAEYSTLQKTGAAIVKGQAFLMTKGGEVRKGAGQTITLRPVTGYAEKLVVYMKRRSLGPLPVGAADFDRTTTSDADGRFEFKDVPAGEYFVAGNVSWSVFYPGTFMPIEEKQGGYIVKKITVAPSGTTEAMLTL